LFLFLGQDTVDIKVAATKRYLVAGANELDILLNISTSKKVSGPPFLQMNSLVNEIKTTNFKPRLNSSPNVAILPDEIKHAAELMLQAKTKTCTGMGPRCSLDDVKCQSGGR
jgi:deoxyribose-phosphate aldolase